MHTGTKYSVEDTVPGADGSSKQVEYEYDSLLVSIARRLGAMLPHRQSFVAYTTPSPY